MDSELAPRRSLAPRVTTWHEVRKSSLQPIAAGEPDVLDDTRKPHPDDSGYLAPRVFSCSQPSRTVIE
jgi:hypothetical protein